MSTVDWRTHPGPLHVNASSQHGSPRVAALLVWKLRAPSASASASKTEAPRPLMTWKSQSIISTGFYWLQSSRSLPRFKGMGIGPYIWIVNGKVLEEPGYSCNLSSFGKYNQPCQILLLEVVRGFVLQNLKPHMVGACALQTKHSGGPGGAKSFLIEMNLVAFELNLARWGRQEGTLGRRRLHF